MKDPRLLKPFTYDESKDAPKYHASFFLLKTDPQVAKLDAAIKTELTEKGVTGGKTFKKDAAEIWPDKTDLHAYFLYNCTAKQDDTVAVGDKNGDPVIDGGEIRYYDQAWFKINIHAYDMPKSKGVTSYIEGALILGEPSELSEVYKDSVKARPTLNNMFAEELGEAPVAEKKAPAKKAPAKKSEPVMTDKADGISYEDFVADGWSDDEMRAEGYLV